MKLRILVWALSVAVFGPGTAFADPAPPPTTIPTLDQPMSSHDGSFFARYQDGGFGLSQLTVSSDDGTIHAGQMTVVTEADLDVVAPGIAVWRPDEPLGAGTYIVEFEAQTGSLEVDPSLDICLMFEEAVVGSEYLTTRGDERPGTSCCEIGPSACAGEGCVDCWPTFNFLSAKATVPLPRFPNSIALRAEWGQGSDTTRGVLVDGTELSVFGSFNQSAPLCAKFDVVDTSFAVLQTDERCGEIVEMPSDDELIREEPQPATCAGDPCTFAASTVERDAVADCPEDIMATPGPSSGCSSATGEPAGAPVLLFLLGMLGGRFRKRQ